jgi:CheY-like chemotaxis protein
MKLQFQLLVVDDHPESVGNSIASLRDHLERNGFSLKVTIASDGDLSPKNLRNLARNSGKNFNLVAVDYNLGRQDVNGARAAQVLRNQLRFTDMIFYSSDPGVHLLEELAAQDVAGVFVSGRDDLDDSLKGLADTVIGKAVDLNHMRGIAMAEVAEMDVMMEEVLESVFACPDPAVRKQAERTLKRILDNGQDSLKMLKKIVEEGEILNLLPNTEVFGSAKRYQAINRVVGVLKAKPDGAMQVFSTFPTDIIGNRNTLAHAKEDVADDGTVTLRSAKRGAAPVVIDDAWMIDFRGKLRAQKNALGDICRALEDHVTTFEAEQPQES